MNWSNRDIAKLNRLGNFPFQVKMLYFSHSHISDVRRGITPDDILEISIRTEPHDAICRDVINGHQLSEKFPNIVWKKPGGRHSFRISHARDTIVFWYPAAQIDDLRGLGLYPGWDSMTFYLTPEIERLTHEYRKLCLQLYAPGVADKLDWLCFRLYREVLYSKLLTTEVRHDYSEKLKNIALMLQVHLTGDIDLDEIARINGFSRTAFFREWKRFFHVSPAQYILNLKMETAAHFLRETDFPISAIVKEVKFSGTTAFYKRFVQKYGMTPMQYRQQAFSKTTARN